MRALEEQAIYGRMNMIDWATPGKTEMGSTVEQPIKG